MSSAGLLTCTNCGSEEPSGSAFCGNCSSPLVTTPEADATDTTTAVAETTGVVVCASCGNEEPGGAEFCGSCGTPFSATPPEPEPVEAWPEPEPGPAPPPATPAAAPSPWRSRPVLAAAGAVLAAGAVVAVLFGTGVVGSSSNSGLLQSAFVSQVNAQVLGPLGLMLESAVDDAGSSDEFARATDGSNIARAANDATAYLQALDGLSDDQRAEVRALLVFVGATRRYGQTFAGLEAGDSASRAAFDDASNEVRSTRARVRRALPADLQLPNDAAFVSSAAVPPPPPPPPPATQPSASAYVQQVDELLRRSRPVVLALRSFIPRASSDAISRGAAVAAARSYLAQRQVELSRAEALQVPPAFAPAQALLIRALRLSVEDDQALVAWAVARRDGSANAQAAFAEANQLGAQATAQKKQFLRVYGQARQQATGRSPTSLPDIF